MAVAIHTDKRQRAQSWDRGDVQDIGAAGRGAERVWVCGKKAESRLG